MALGEALERDRRAERREATRTEILEQAWDLAREEGLAGISLGQLAKRVGMRAPSLYSYFDSKNAIYDAMFAQGLAELAEVRSANEVPRTREEFMAAARDFVAFCTENPARYHLIFQRTIPGFEPAPETYAASVRLLELTKKALEAVGITAPEAIDVYTAIMTGLTDQQISNDPGGDRWSRLTDDVIGMFLDRYAEKGGRR